MLPNANHRKPFLPQYPNCHLISLSISRNFSVPEGGPCFRDVAAPLAAMPEAAVHENDEADGGKEYVWPPSERWRVKLPSLQAGSD
jgi:hypothetical protein